MILIFAVLILLPAIISCAYYLGKISEYLYGIGKELDRYNNLMEGDPK